MNPRCKSSKARWEKAPRLTTYNHPCVAGARVTCPERGLAGYRPAHRTEADASGCASAVQAGVESEEMPGIIVRVRPRKNLAPRSTARRLSI